LGDKTRKITGLLWPAAPFAFRCWDRAQLWALEIPTAWRNDGPVRTEKFFIHSLLRLAFGGGVFAWAGLGAGVWGCGLRAKPDAQIPALESHGNSSVQPLFNPHFGSAQPRPYVLALNLIQLALSARCSC
jgi:hypothetical protein